ncbi:DoxX family protein [Massilia niastensis]|uniref:DoxX family protein n=1 Tax=Massilia niastensis TaxID=544911 RepID=UPI000372C6D4|nr:DoxX family protein [Massilia niastensis]
METPNQTRATTEDQGKFLLRALLAFMLLFHGVSKLLGGVDSIEGMLAKAGLPAFLAYGVYVGEVVAPFLILVGLYTRLAAAIVAINMIVAVMLVHTSEFFTLSKSGGWALELQGMFFGTAIVLVFLGAGRYSIGGLHGRFN